EGEGTLKGTAVFSYEDASGKTKNITKEFSCEVTADQGPGEVSSEPSEQPKAQNTPPLWAILTGAGALVLLTVGFLVFRKKRKAKKLRMMEASDDYDDVG
ncbi:MAG TPA: LPXTG cell wall anchor domain-containing protein, partial [Caproiciproducens sp.]|nr:LPXTG cell wall anchor domain-containing protein [Caproiciproducens sp.]